MKLAEVPRDSEVVFIGFNLTTEDDWQSLSDIGLGINEKVKVIDLNDQYVKILLENGREIEIPRKLGDKIEVIET